MRPTASLPSSGSGWPYRESDPKEGKRCCQVEMPIYMLHGIVRANLGTRFDLNIMRLWEATLSCRRAGKRIGEQGEVREDTNAHRFSKGC